MSDDIKAKIEDALFNFYLEADKNTIDNAIKDSLHDLEVYNQKKRKILFLATAVARHKHNEVLLELAAKFQEAILHNVQKPVAILRQLIQNNESLAYYKSLDTLSKDDIIEIIKDKNLVELLEKLDNAQNE